MNQEESEAKTDSQTTETPSAEWVIPPDGISEAYIDWYHVNWMPLTIRIRLGQVIPNPKLAPERATWAVGERAAVTMPWATAKALAEFITKLVKAYEKENGEIIVPKLPSL